MNQRPFCEDVAIKRLFECRLSILEAAKALKITSETVRVWVDSGKLKAIVEPSGRRVIKVSDVYDYLVKDFETFIGSDYDLKGEKR